MKLPNAQRAIVERAKIVEYLLNAAHPDNGGKAKFFTERGFAAERWEVLAQALRNMAVGVSVIQSVQSVHGSKYVLEGQMETPIGKQAAVRSVWIIDAGSQLPRLVTAYPRKK